MSEDKPSGSPLSEVEKMLIKPNVSNGISIGPFDAESRIKAMEAALARKILKDSQNVDHGYTDEQIQWAQVTDLVSSMKPPSDQFRGGVIKPLDELSTPGKLALKNKLTNLFKQDFLLDGGIQSKGLNNPIDKPKGPNAP